ncbi:MAG: peptide chain release factor 2 [Candidatus Hydrogenedentes bacterium]|nr:peptide chain release factor 2 [Candidatus Hydrogenedentota bacterium]
MYEEQAAQIEGYAARLKELRKNLNTDSVKAQIAVIEKDMTAPNFWDDNEAAQGALQNLKRLKGIVTGPEALEKDIEDGLALVEMASEEDDASMQDEIVKLAEELDGRLKRIELSSLFSDPRDNHNVMLSIHPGAGGTESCDWADMLLRMILRYCERQGFEVEILDTQPGDEAGLKSASLKISGPFAYGNLKSENGVHRLVRISPFDANKRRHTSFTAIEVLSEIDDDIDIEVREEDLKMDVFRSSGAGGQKVNKTSSAVRLTHLPTGIVTTCQIERSQHRNRATALQFLKAKLYDIEVKKQEAELAAQREGQQDVAWGSQIRSYVLQPYQMVKDHRTDAETSNVDRVLDGDLDLFVEAYLRWNLEGRKKKLM